jgi:hypothetical protein
LPLMLVDCPHGSCFSLAAHALPWFVSLASCALPSWLMSRACASLTSAQDTPPRLVKCRGRCFAIAACASPLFFVLAASPSLLVHCPSTLPLQLMACAHALPSACATPPRLVLCRCLTFAALLCPPFWPSRLCPLCLCVTLMLCPCSKWLALALCCQLTFFSLAALPLLLGQRSCALPLLQMASAHALSSARILCRCRFAVAVRALPSCLSVAANGSRSRFAVSLRPLPLRLCGQCLCFAIAANSSRSHFAVSLRSAPSRLLRRCSCVALVLHHHSKWLTLALCR